MAASALNFLLLRVAMTPAAAFSRRPDGFQSTSVPLTKSLSTGGHVTYEVTIYIKGAATFLFLFAGIAHFLSHFIYDLQYMHEFYSSG